MISTYSVHIVRVVLIGIAYSSLEIYTSVNKFSLFFSILFQQRTQYKEYSIVCLYLCLCLYSWYVLKCGWDSIKYLSTSFSMRRTYFHMQMGLTRAADGAGGAAANFGDAVKKYQ